MQNACPNRTVLESSYSIQEVPNSPSVWKRDDVEEMENWPLTSLPLFSILVKIFTGYGAAQPTTMHPSHSCN
jgi:hypothetical protein